jgi:hypothetical protein
MPEASSRPPRKADDSSSFQEIVEALRSWCPTIVFTSDGRRLGTVTPVAPFRDAGADPGGEAMPAGPSPAARPDEADDSTATAAQDADAIPWNDAFQIVSPIDALVPIFDGIAWLARKAGTSQAVDQALKQAAAADEYAGGFHKAARLLEAAGAGEASRWIDGIGAGISAFEYGFTRAVTDDVVGMIKSTDDLVRAFSVEGLTNAALQQFGLPVDPSAPNATATLKPIVDSAIGAVRFGGRVLSGDPTLLSDAAKAAADAGKALSGMATAIDRRYLQPLENDDPETFFKNYGGDAGGLAGHLAVAVATTAATDGLAALVKLPVAAGKAAEAVETLEKVADEAVEAEKLAGAAKELPIETTESGAPKELPVEPTESAAPKESPTETSERPAPEELPAEPAETAPETAEGDHVPVKFNPETGAVYALLPSLSNPNVRRWMRTVAEQLSNRYKYLGNTPSKYSAIGLKVQERMRQAGTLEGEGENIRVLGSDKKWYPIAETDMGHKKAAVDFWNEEGRFFGPRSARVREFMNDVDNYTLQPSSINRSEGARMLLEGKRYQLPATLVEKLEYLQKHPNAWIPL